MPSTAEIQRLVDQIKSSRPFESLEATQKLVELSRETERSNDATRREMQEQMTKIAEAVQALTEALLQQRPEVLSRDTGASHLQAGRIKKASRDPLVEAPSGRPAG